MASGARSHITLCFLTIWHCFHVVANATTPSQPVPTEDCYPENFWRLQGWTDYEHVFERCGPELVCRKDLGTCEEFCNVDEECEGFPHRVCDGKLFKCKHVGLFKGSVGADVGAAILFSFISGLALSAGIGGGGLYVPLLMIILGFSVREAAGLSQACLSGGSASALVYNMRQRHPTGKKPMIDYTLVLVMGPSLLIGALLGSSLNPSAPAWLILVLLMIVLSQSAWKAFGKAITTLRKEQSGEVRGMTAAGDGRLSKNLVARFIRLISGKEYTQHQDQECELPGIVIGQPAENDVSGLSDRAVGSAATEEAAAAYVVGKPVAAESVAEVSGEKPAAGQVLGPLDAEKAGISRNAQPSRSHEDSNSSSAAADVQPAGMVESATGLASIHVDLGASHPSQEVAVSNSAPISADATAADAGEQRQYPRRKLMGFASMWLITALGILVRGGKSASTFVPYCSVWYWLIPVLMIAALASISFQSARRAVKEAIAKPERAPEIEGELQWTVQTAMSVVRWSLMAGTLAALCGIGGGMVMGPILLDLGFLPQVQSATTATTLFVMSTSTCLAFLVAGTVPVDYAAWLAVATGVGAVFGKALIGYAVKKLRRPSIIMFLLAGIIALSVVVLSITGIIDIVNDIRNGKEMLFQSFCPSAEDP